MVRSMYSGVAGMKAHQTRMDVIGNNVSNVNTYGFKSSRVTFRDVYYQATKSGSAADANRGGINPSMVGYGAQIASIDVNQTQSSFTSTGNPLDVAIAGDGFFQVQDSDGNIFYTKAGMFDIDSLGNLVDLNGNFVLGVSGSPLGKDASSDRIKISIPSVDPAPPTFADTINDIQYTITGSNNTEDGNVVFNFVPASDLPIGQRVSAVLSSSGVTVRVNPTEYFESLNDFQSAVNQAITTANGGVQHPAGTFSFQMSKTSNFDVRGVDGNTGKNIGLTGAEIVGSEYGVKLGSVDVPAGLWGGAKLDTVGDQFHSTGVPTFTVEHTLPKAAEYNQDGTVKTPAVVEAFNFKITIAPNGAAAADAAVYTARVEASQLVTARKVMFKRASADPNDTTAVFDEADTVTLSLPSYGSIVEKIYDKTKLNAHTPYTDADKTAGIIPQGYAVGDKGPLQASQDTDLIATETTKLGTSASPSADSLDLGLGSKPLLLTGGTVGGPQSVKDLTGISIGADGIITATHAVHGELELGRIDLATFENAQSLQECGNTYFTTSQNSGTGVVVKPGTHGTGELKSSALEQSNVDLSQEFADLIVTQRGFQANSRLINVSDTMLEELINLKR